MDSDLKVFILRTLALTRASLKSRYRKTYLGFLWVVINPLVVFSTQAFIFGLVLKIPMENYYSFLLSGLIPWIFFVQSVEMCVGLFVNNGPIIRSFPVNPSVYLLSQILDNFINFIAVFLPLTFLLLAIGPIQSLSIFFLPLSILTLLVGTTGIAWLLATAQVFFRDVKFMVSFALQILYFLTPIFYPLEMIPADHRWLVNLNPLYHLLSPFQTLLNEQNYEKFLSKMGIASMVSFSLLLIAILIWRWKGRAVPRYV